MVTTFMVGWFVDGTYGSSLNQTATWILKSKLKEKERFTCDKWYQKRSSWSIPCQRHSPRNKANSDRQ